MREFTIRRRASAYFATLVVALALFGAPAAGQTERFNPPKAFYLALGDSITYGFQASKAEAGLPPSAFNTGYVDVFGARMRDIQPGLRIVNYGCPGETTTTFIAGTCLGKTIGFPLHDSFQGTQLEAAVAFLDKHRGQVNPITLTLWGNDVSRFVESCGGDLDCVQAGAPDLIRHIAENLAFILGRLRAAAADAEIIVTGAWDSFLDVLAFADPLFQALNQSISSVAAAHRVRFADPFPLFNPQGDMNAEIQRMCTLTLLCTEGDSHPSDAGYQVLGDLVFDVSGYARLVEPVSLISTARAASVLPANFGQGRCEVRQPDRWLQ